MKEWMVGILFGGFFGFTVAILALLLGLKTYGEAPKNPILQAVQVLLIVFFGWLAWKSEGIETLVGYVLGSFYIVRLLFLPDKKKKLE